MRFLDNHTLPVWAVLTGYVVCLAAWALVGWWLTTHRGDRDRW